MNRTRTNDRYSRARNGGVDSGKGGSRFGSSAARRPAGPNRSGGYGRQPAAVQGEFAPPRTITPALPSVEDFADLDMPGELLAALGSAGVTVPFPIQAATLPNSLAGRDVLGRGRTGSGKTLAFGLALLARTAGQRAEARQPLGLVLVPTRELAQQVTALLDQVRPEGQRMLFSATLDRNVDLLVRRYLSDPVVHSVDPSAGAVTTMEHHVLHVHGADKHAATTEIAARDGRVIMFLDTKHAVDRLTQDLLNSGVRAAALHGGKSQPQRTRTLAQFKTGHVTVLVATNVAARGIHVDNLDLVVNVDPPTDHKDYLHRGGRTARAGESGSVVTLVTPNQRRGMVRLMSDAGIRPQTTQVRSGDEALSRITGAQAPTGIPVVITAPVAERPKKRGATSRGRRRPASATRRAPAPQSTAGAAA
ncbi:DEAD/DEAH box helicase [Streptomyces rochei]|uniref:DEAD/DEAH box helicase n=1 Tax=Streptomyces rochei TaxID=1928 RepID=UPI002ACE3C4B|nr:DEAD/DEAH box helicase [Streptomyces rochei]WQC10339.1 DEAD/DEAH box helicase [Streptomyces rochei]WQC17336.1 DEAD/DEAH box helicase [Streptomyces rochei]